LACAITIKFGPASSEVGRFKEILGIPFRCDQPRSKTRAVTNPDLPFPGGRLYGNATRVSFPHLDVLAAEAARPKLRGHFLFPRQSDARHHIRRGTHSSNCSSIQQDLLIAYFLICARSPSAVSAFWTLITRSPNVRRPTEISNTGALVALLRPAVPAHQVIHRHTKRQR
jgi:hypothetical protein